MEGAGHLKLPRVLPCGPASRKVPSHGGPDSFSSQAPGASASGSHVLKVLGRAPGAAWVPVQGTGSGRAEGGTTVVGTAVTAPGVRVL